MKTKIKIQILIFAIMLLPVVNLTSLYGQDQSTTVELNGDTIEYSIDGNVVNAQGNVVIIYKGTTLLCDKVEFYRDAQKAKAQGNVTLKSEEGEISGDKLTFDFKTMTGELNDAKIYTEPFFGAAKEIERIDEQTIQMRHGYVSTSDYDDPEYRLKASTIEVRPGDKLIARKVRMVLGNIPVMYLPRYTQSLKDGKPGIVVVPGYDKQWGMFVLTKWRYILSENFKGKIHLDAREKKDLAWGIDADYKTKKVGEGLIRTYYMKERNITSKRWWDERPTPTTEVQRYKALWRHKWDIDNKTSTIMQFYRLSDANFLKDYFEREYREDYSPETFFLLTRNLPKGTFSFQANARVNRFESKVEKLPEIRYDLPGANLFNSGIYYDNTTIYSNFASKSAAPSEDRKETMRVDTSNEISYPKKIGIIEFKPFVGAEHTYYSKTLDPSIYDSVRGQFRTGATLSTKFYRLFDAQFNKYGLELNKLRHVVTPTVSYSYYNDPTIHSSQLDYFDSIDALTNSHNINFALENKLQTKRKEETVELLRFITSTDFKLKEDPAGGGFNNVKNEIDFRPINWLTFYMDSFYDCKADHLSTANFDMYINGNDKKWALSIGKRYNREVDDQITLGFAYNINPKWNFEFYERYDIEHGEQKEQQYKLIRDLHSWLMEIDFREKRSEGSEILLIFTLKAFPDIGIDAGTSFNQRKAGSQTAQ